jgi:hypothetical protein
MDACGFDIRQSLSSPPGLNLAYLEGGNSMTKHMPAAMFEQDSIVAITSVTPDKAEPAGHVFDLPPVLHGLTVACYFGFLGIMAAAFGNREMILPFVVFFFFVAMGFAVPAQWARMAPSYGRLPTWADFRRTGIDCATGRLSSGSAIAQVMMLPVLILIWAIVVAIIASAV